jgi:APA family basic amino acid/polyamine antiporter
MQALWGKGGARLTALLLMVSTVGCLNGLILGGARLMYAMAHDRVFFRIAARLNDASVPGFALMIQALWASMLALSGDFGDLLDYLGAAGSLFGILTIAAVFVMRFKRPAARRPYRVRASFGQVCIEVNSTDDVIEGPDRMFGEVKANREGPAPPSSSR